jgi:hypothetical protein
MKRVIYVRSVFEQLQRDRPPAVVAELTEVGSYGFFGG